MPSAVRLWPDLGGAARFVTLGPARGAAGAAPRARVAPGGRGLAARVGIQPRRIGPRPRHPAAVSSDPHVALLHVGSCVLAQHPPVAPLGATVLTAATTRTAARPATGRSRLAPALVPME